MAVRIVHTALTGPATAIVLVVAMLIAPQDPQFNKPFNPFFRAPQRTPPKPVPAKSSPPKSNNAAVKGGSGNSNKFNNKPAPNKFKARKPKKTPTKMWFQPGGVPRRQPPQQNQNQFRGGKGRGGKGKNNSRYLTW